MREANEVVHDLMQLAAHLEGKGRRADVELLTEATQLVSLLCYERDSYYLMLLAATEEDEVTHE